MNVILVETPAQAKRVAEALGAGWRVEPCAGLEQDAPDPAHTGVRPPFAPAEASDRRARVRQALAECQAVYAATPPGPAGEWLAWRALALAHTPPATVCRVTLSALMAPAIREAFADPRPLNRSAIEAEAARRQIEPLTAEVVAAAARQHGHALPAVSRTALVALCRLAAPAEPTADGWTLALRVRLGEIGLRAAVHTADGARIRLSTPERAQAAVRMLQTAQYWVTRSGQREHVLHAPAPCTVPALLLEAERWLGIVPADALRLLATLYDATWITHPEAAPPARLYADARDFIRSEYGAAYVPEELTAPAGGIAPADIRRIPDALPGDGAALYRLIWTRFVAAQLPPARLRQTGVQLGVGADRERPYPLTLWGLHTRIAFDGWLRLMPEALAPSEDEPPEVLAGDAVRVAEIEVERLASDAGTPDAGTTAAAVIARYGSARPAAWCAALQALQAADLVRMDGDRLTVSERGAALAAWLGERFPALVGDDADAGLERALQHIAAGAREADPVVHAFRERLSADLRRASPPRPVVLRPAREV
jgi:DNA topoisomerase-1